MRLLFFSDIHHELNEDKHYIATKDVLPGFWEMLKSEKNKVDYAVFGGDLTVAGTAKIEELKDFKKRLDKIGIPYIVTPGNHDLAPNSKIASGYPGLEDYENKCLEETNFFKVFGLDGIRYDCIIGQIMIIAFAIREEDPDHQLYWLGSKLELPYPKMIFCHYPLIPARDGGFCLNWGYSRIGKIKEELREMICAKESNVLGYFCGHLHLNSVKKMGTTPQIVNGASGLATVSYKEIHIDKNRISVKTKFMPGYNDIYGPIMGSDDSIDVSHNDIRSYHLGNDDERDFDIPIK